MTVKDLLKILIEHLDSEGDVVFRDGQIHIPDAQTGTDPPWYYIYE